jgi:hypothetical protein
MANPRAVGTPPVEPSHLAGSYSAGVSIKARVFLPLSDDFEVGAEVTCVQGCRLLLLIALTFLAGARWEDHRRLRASDTLKQANRVVNAAKDTVEKIRTVYLRDNQTAVKAAARYVAKRDSSSLH